MKLPSLYLVALATLLSGCVGRLQTTPYLVRTDRLTSALPGVTYSLPKLQYEVKLTRYLAECPGVVDGKPTALKFAVNIEATPQYVPGEAYTIDYERLSGFTRTSNFEIKYWPNGNLKSVGAGAEDQTAEILKDVVKTGLAIASATQGTPPLPFTTESVRSPGAGDGVVCTDTALGLVKDRSAKAQELEKNAVELKKLQVKIERIEKRATLKLVNRKDREALLALFDSVDTETAKAEDLKEELAALTGQLAVADEFTWDSDITQPGAEQERLYNLLEDQTKKLAGLLQLGPLAPLTGEDAQGEAQRKTFFPSCFADAPEVKKCVEQQLNLRATVALQTAVPKCPREQVAWECLKPAERGYRPARDSKPDDGLFVREPAHGRLLFCRAAYGKCTTDVDEAGMTQVYFPQLGQLRYLPLKVGTFQAKNMTLLMTEDGRVESFSYNSTKAPGQVLASAAADIATQVDAAIEKRETERRDDRAYARAEEAAAVQSEIDRLTKELELRKAKEALVPDPLKSLNDETTLMQAEVTSLEVRLAKLKAESALAEASAAPGG